MSTPFNQQFKDRMSTLITRFGTTGVITHADDNTTSRVRVAFSSRDENDVAADGFGTLVGEQITAYCTAPKVNSNIGTAKDVLVGDTIVANSTTYRISDVRPYQPAGLNIAYRLLLDL